jgi:hypothetical protein
MRPRYTVGLCRARAGSAVAGCTSTQGSARPRNDRLASRFVLAEPVTDFVVYLVADQLFRFELPLLNLHHVEYVVQAGHGQPIVNALLVAGVDARVIPGQVQTNYESSARARRQLGWALRDRIIVHGKAKPLACPGCGLKRPTTIEEVYERPLDGGCCNSLCRGRWGTGCFHCHHPDYHEAHLERLAGIYEKLDQICGVAIGTTAAAVAGPGFD